MCLTINDPFIFYISISFFPFFRGSSKTGKLGSRALIVKRVLTQSNSGDPAAPAEHLYHHKEALGFSSETQDPALGFPEAAYWDHAGRGELRLERGP